MLKSKKKFKIQYTFEMQKNIMKRYQFQNDLIERVVTDNKGSLKYIKPEMKFISSHF